MGNPSCPICGEILRTGNQEGMIGRGTAPAWVCDQDQVFWYRGRSVILAQTAIKLGKGFIRNLSEMTKEVIGKK